MIRVHGELLKRPKMWQFGGTDTIFPMRDILILFVHLIVTVARLTGPGGIRSVVAESVLVRHQLLILTRGRKRPPNLCTADRILAGLCPLSSAPRGLFVRLLFSNPPFCCVSTACSANGSTASCFRPNACRSSKVYRVCCRAFG